MRRLLDEDFSDGFVTDGPGARWTYAAAGDYVADDGVVGTGRHGLRVLSSGINPATGTPAFVRTTGQQADGGLGQMDHLKWFAFAAHTSSGGFPGYDAEPGRVLSCEAWLTARTFGTEGHPYADDVDDPDRDPRLACATVNAVDPETSLVFDFLVTNRQVYALYERLADRRGELGDYAAFSYVIPVGEREPAEHHHLAIAYDRAAGAVRWLVDGEERVRVDDLGARLRSRKHLAIDLGGEDQQVEPRQLWCGLGTLTLLDGELPGRAALVRLSSDSPFYFDPSVGAPAPQVFRDDASRVANRLFGQGVDLAVRRFVVATAPSKGEDR